MTENARAALAVCVAFLALAGCAREKPGDQRPFPFEYETYPPDSAPTATPTEPDGCAAGHRMHYLVVSREMNPNTGYVENYIERMTDDQGRYAERGAKLGYYADGKRNEVFVKVLSGCFHDMPKPPEPSPSATTFPDTRFMPTCPPSLPYREPCRLTTKAATR